MNDSFRDTIRVAGKEDENCQGRAREMGRIRESGQKMTNSWIEKDW